MSYRDDINYIWHQYNAEKLDESLEKFIVSVKEYKEVQKRFREWQAEQKKREQQPK